MKKTLLKSSMLFAAFFMLLSFGSNGQQQMTAHKIKRASQTNVSAINSINPYVENISLRKGMDAVSFQKKNFKSTAAETTKIGGVFSVLNQDLSSEYNVYEGVYAFNYDIDPGQIYEIYNTLGDYSFYWGVAVGNTYYAMVYTNDSNQYLYYIKINLTTGELIGEPQGVTSAADAPFMMTYVPVRECGYGFAPGSVQGSYDVVTFNLETGKGTVIISDVQEDLVSIFWHPMGYILSYGADGYLYAIAPSNQVAAITDRPFVNTRYEPYYSNEYPWGAIEVAGGTDDRASALVYAYLYDTQGETLVPSVFEIYMERSGESMSIGTEASNIEGAPLMMMYGVFDATEVGLSIENDFVDNNDFKVYGNAGNIEIDGIEGERVTVYSIDGRQVYNGLNTTIPVAKGIYVVKVADQTSKVIVK